MKKTNNINNYEITTELELVYRHILVNKID